MVRRAGPRQGERAGEAESEHPALAAAGVVVEGLVRASRDRPGRGGVQVAGEVGGHAPPPAGDGGHRADPDAEVVRRVPVGEAVPAFVAGSREVRRLVPGVAGGLESIDHLAVGVLGEVLVDRGAGAGERAPRLHLELVPGDVVGGQVEDGGEVVVEVVRGLARHREHEIHAQIGEPRRAGATERRPHLIRGRARGRAPPGGAAGTTAPRARAG